MIEKSTECKGNQGKMISFAIEAISELINDYFIQN